MTEKLTKCKSCGTEIAKVAKMCPHCGRKNKKPFYMRVWFWVLIIIVVAFVGSNKSGDTNTATNIETTTNAETSANGVQEDIEYVKYDVSTMVDDLESNALNAKTKYDKQYVEITGELSNIDSSGSYINISSTKSDFSLITVQCYIKNDEQLSKISQMSKGDIITVKGKIKSVGEVLGYGLDITEIP